MTDWNSLPVLTIMQWGHHVSLIIHSKTFMIDSLIFGTQTLFLKMLANYVYIQDNIQAESVLNP